MLNEYNAISTVELTFCLSTKYFSLSYFCPMSLLLNYIVHQVFVCITGVNVSSAKHFVCLFAIYEFGFQRYFFFFQVSLAFFGAIYLLSLRLRETLNSFCICVPKWIEPNSASANTHIKISMQTVYALILNKLAR